MDKDKLYNILREHDKWLKKESGVKAKLQRMDLSGVDLSNHDLTGGDLTGSSLKGANLKNCTLKSMSLSGVDLKDADISGANFHGCDFRGAGLNGVPLMRFQYQRDEAHYQFDGMIRVACEYYSVDHWVENYQAIGEANQYTDEQIEMYGEFFKWCKRLEESK